MSERTCGNCRWWVQYAGLTVGDCRRHPPTGVDNEWAATEKAESCGEWADKTITPEQEERRELVRRLAVAIAGTEWCSNPAEEVWRLATMLADAEPGNSGREI